MALSKATKAALDAWKEGKGEFPESLEAGVHFENDGAFMSAVDSKAKKREQAAREAATAELLEKLGITDPAEIEQIKAKLDASGAAQTEVEKLKVNHDKAAKELVKEKARTADLTTKLQGIAKRDALSVFAPRVRSQKALAALLEGQLVVGDDGAVTGPEGKSVESMVDELLKTEEYLKSPDFKEGAGTKATAKTTEFKGPIKPPVGEDGKEGQLTRAQGFVNELAAAGWKPPGADAAGP